MTSILVDFLIQCFTLSIVILLPCFILALIFKKKRKIIYSIGISAVVIFSILVSLNTEINKEKNQSSFENISSQDKVRINEIVRGIGQNNSIYLTDEIHNEYWSILNKYGGISSNELEDVGLELIELNSYMKLYYEDALQSFKTGTPHKSHERNEFETKLLKNGTYTDYDIQRNDKNIDKIALQEEIIVSGNNVIFDEELINGALENVKSVNDRYEQLFTE